MDATIVMLPGDGVGPEVAAEARKVLQAVAGAFDHSLIFTDALIGGIAIDETGSALPDETAAACKAANAVVLGAVGGPEWDDPNAPVRPEQGLLKIRKELGVYANLRPVRVHPALANATPLRPELVKGLDVLVMRELTGGIYFGDCGRGEHETGEFAYDTMIYTTAEIERITRIAADVARTRRGKVTSVDKANVLSVSRLWRATVQQVMDAEYPDVELEHILVDTAAMYLVQQPLRFDVIVTGNMFGDILTDEASVLAGSMGLLPSASIGSGGPGLYEPIHGSAPDIAGKGIANPIGTILSAAMLCRYSLKLEEEAVAIEQAVDAVIDSGARTVDIAEDKSQAISTAEMGDRIMAAIGS
ncbi:MAG: 3-isopropylmalate dehydrogenase [Planctomycetota bacterium]|jgi:3-isopropylmalate dehydrogenase